MHLPSEVGSDLAHVFREKFAHHEEKLRFLAIGVWNTLFSMGSLWVLDRLVASGLGSPLAGFVGVLAARQIVLTLSWVVGVTQNLFSFKLLVFRTKGNWLREYLRMYVTYSGIFILDSAIVQILSATLGWSLFWSRLPSLVVTTLLSYFGHKYFTFRPKRESRVSAPVRPGL